MNRICPKVYNGGCFLSNICDHSQIHEYTPQCTDVQMVESYHFGDEHLNACPTCIELLCFLSDKEMTL